jgi:deazaflavin-dependent oxidoreductase (nitroreductase family)
VPLRGSIDGMSALHGKEHVDRYRATAGEDGHDWRQGTSTLLLTTTGAKSGEPRTAALIYAKHGDDYLVVASKGGSDAPPGWYANLQDDPEVEVQVWGDRFKARGRRATPEEREEMWPIMTAEWPDYDAYQLKTQREIPIVVLERA